MVLLICPFMPLGQVNVLEKDVLVLSSEETTVHPACYASCDNKNNECLSRSISIKILQFILASSVVAQSLSSH